MMVRSTITIVLVLASTCVSAPAPPTDADLPEETRYYLAMYEAVFLGTIKRQECSLRAEDRPAERMERERKLRVTKPRLYTERIDLIDKTLAAPEKYINRALTPQERAALKAKRAEIDRAYQRAIERGEVEKNPPR